MEERDDGWRHGKKKPRKRKTLEIVPCATAPDDRADLIISRNSVITKARESVGKRRARLDDLYFQLDSRRIERESLS